MEITGRQFRFIVPEFNDTMNKYYNNGVKIQKTPHVIKVINDAFIKCHIDTRYRACHFVTQIASTPIEIYLAFDNFDDFMIDFCARWNENHCSNLADSDNGKSDSMLTAISYKMSGIPKSMQYKRLYFQRSKMVIK